MFTKTDLAKFENVWDEKPRYVNLGAQKNFAQYARRIGQMWDKNHNQFNELYFKKIIARAILFRKMEKLVSAQTWYDGGYRANIVAYTLAMISKLCSDDEKSMNFPVIWEKQDISDTVLHALELTAKLVNDDITNPIPGISNISEWCKKEACWDRLKNRTQELKSILPVEFTESLISKEEIAYEEKLATKEQKIENGMVAQMKILSIPSSTWLSIMQKGQKKRLFSEKEIGILQTASKIPDKIPSEKQSLALLKILDKARKEGIRQ